MFQSIQPSRGVSVHNFQLSEMHSKHIVICELSQMLQLP
jgi:hypothetical protein